MPYIEKTIAIPQDTAMDCVFDGGAEVESICISISVGDADIGVATVEPGGKQMSTGHLHLMGSIPHFSTLRKIKATLLGGFYF